MFLVPLSFESLMFQVTSPYGKNLHHMENVTVGEFAFTTQESGNYMACFTADAKSHGNKNVSISVDWKTGIAAKDWKNIAKKEKIEVSFQRHFLLFFYTFLKTFKNMIWCLLT